MAFATGTVTQVFSKEIPEDRFGNTFRHAIKIEGDDSWYGMGSGKRDSINLKDGDGWHQLGKGDVIEFMYDQNGQYKNVQKKTISLKAKGGPAPQQHAPVQKAPTPQQVAAPAASGRDDYWKKKLHSYKKWDEYIREFNERTGLLRKLN